MMREEFEKLTGFYPTTELYKAIEDAYNEFPGDKNAFCDAYVSNKDGLAERIARNVDWTQIPAEKLLARAKEEAAGEVKKLTAEIERLKKQLEREEEWKPYEDEHNVSQSNYEAIASTSSARELTDDEAADMIAKEFGFDRTKITIVHEVRQQEINRHRKIRNVGTFHRKALFDVWDWNYICFNVHGNSTMGYEMYNGELQMYWG